MGHSTSVEGGSEGGSVVGRSTTRTTKTINSEDFHLLDDIHENVHENEFVEWQTSGYGRESSNATRRSKHGRKGSRKDSYHEKFRSRSESAATTRRSTNLKPIGENDFFSDGIDEEKCTKHNLRGYIAPRRFICNECKEVVKADSLYFLCRDCNFDCCVTCGVIKYQAEPSQFQEVPDAVRNGALQSYTSLDSATSVSSNSEEGSSSHAGGSNPSNYFEKQNTLNIRPSSYDGFGRRDSGNKGVHGVCKFCFAHTITFGDKCGTCRKGPVGRRCRVCHCFFQGYRDLCEECQEDEEKDAVVNKSAR